MKVTCQTGALLEALQVVSTAVVARTPKPALQCILVEVEANSLTLVATDLQVGIRYRLEQVEVQEPGTGLVPADRFLAIVRECPDKTLSLQVEGNACRIDTADSHFTLNTSEVETFPKVSDSDGPDGLRITCGVLRGMIHRTLFAAAKESSRYAINGVLWAPEGKSLLMVATDGRRLAQVRAELVAGTSEATVIVPVKTMTLLDRCLTDTDQELTVSFQENRIIAKLPQVVISSTLVEGTFPKYQEVVPHDTTVKVQLRTEVLLSAFRRAALLTTENSQGVRMQFSKGQLVLTGRAAETGEGKVELGIEYEYDDMEIGFNPHYVLEALRVVGTEDISLELKGANAPGLIRSGEDFLYVVMPVNLS